MSRKKNGFYWLIEGFDGTTKIYEKRVDAGQFTTDQAKPLLRALVAKAGLTFDEIIGAYAKRRTRIANAHLEVRKDGPYPVFYCGSNPHFVISARNPDGIICGKKNTPEVALQADD